MCSDQHHHSPSFRTKSVNSSFSSTPSSKSSFKNVTFDFVPVFHTVSKLTAKEHAKVWLSKDDLACIREQNKETLRKARAGMLVESHEETIRGLENMIHEEQGLQLRCKAFGAVLYEQRASENAERIAHAYHVASRNSVKIAWFSGQRDAMESLSNDGIHCAKKDTRKTVRTSAGKATLAKLSAILLRRFGGSSSSLADREMNSISKR